ncbi:MAG: O-methyltransferase [Clostridia bacterium]|nr:O-methyltransferase [Clostridia bacterium]
MNITNNIVAAYIDSLYKSSNADLQNLREMSVQNHVPIIQKDAENLLKVIMKLKKPARVLEIGTAVGYSSCVFTECCGCQVTTIELDDATADIAESNIRNMGFSDRINVLRGDGREVLKELQKGDFSSESDKYDILFVDAAKSHYREFWDLSMPMLKEDCIIICDNVLQKGMTASDEFDTRGRYKTSIRHMRNFIDYITSLDNFDTVVSPTGDGLSISIRKHNE